MSPSHFTLMYLGISAEKKAIMINRYAQASDKKVNTKIRLDFRKTRKEMHSLKFNLILALSDLAILRFRLDLYRKTH